MKSVRHESQLVYGVHAIDALLRHRPQSVQRVIIQEGSPNRRIQGILSLARECGVELTHQSRIELDELAKDHPHQGVIALCTPQPPGNETDLGDLLDGLEMPPFLLILDGVQDPHNLGACLRSANAAGVHAVIAPRDRAVGLTSVARKAASGAAEITPFIQVTNLARTMKALQGRGVWLFGATDDAETTLYDADLSGPMAWVLGAEGKGLRRLTREHCDHLVRIPMTSGAVSSLNVSVATGICLFEAVRQRVRSNLSHTAGSDPF